jgi:hypothetical protein
MQKTKNSHLTMHLSSQVVLNENEESFDSFTAYPEKKESFDNGVSAEQSLANSLESRKRNSAAAKTIAKDLAAEYISDLKSKVSAYAVVSKNQALLNNVRFTPSKIRRSSDNEFVFIFETVLASAVENNESVEEYGVSAKLISEGNVLLANLKTEMQNLLLSKIDQKQFTTQLNKQFRATDAVLQTVDAMVETMRVSNPVLYRKYRDARRKKRTATAKLSVIGIIIDAETRLPLPKAKINLQNSNSSKAASGGSDLAKNVKIAGAKGGFRLKSMTAGSYLFVGSYFGYTDLEVLVHINEGILTRVEIPLTKLNPETGN